MNSHCLSVRPGQGPGPDVVTLLSAMLGGEVQETGRKWWLRRFKPRRPGEYGLLSHVLSLWALSEVPGYHGAFSKMALQGPASFFSLSLPENIFSH